MSHDDHARPSSDPEPAVYRLTLRYDGRGYHGWQRHPGKTTVQGVFESAIEAIYATPCALHAAGRTDRGAHAEAQVAHFEAPFALETDYLLERLNSGLAEDLQVLQCEQVPSGFHARDDAIAKTYRYEIWNAPECPQERDGRVWHIPGKLDVDAMEAACALLVGRHDFASFAKNTNYSRKSTTRHLLSVRLTRHDPLLVMHFEADGFLYKMVRNLVRAIVKVGEGRWSPVKLQQALAARDRKAAPGTAPASGLFLESVQYESADGEHRAS